MLHVVFMLVLSCFTAASLKADPEAIYLTWRDDPRVTIMVNWITSHTDDDDVVEYRETNCDDCLYTRVTGTHKRLNVNNKYQIHHADLKNLKPGTSYSFRLQTERDDEFSFLTMDDNLSSPKRFVLGGDVFKDHASDITDDDFRKMNELAASYDPFCVFLGGDLSYAGNNPQSFKYWIKFFEIWWKSMRTDGNRLIPMVTAIGNHELEDADKTDISKILYFDFFPAVDGKAYYQLNFGSTMSMFILDPGNVNGISTEQKSWLEAHLKQEKSRDHLFALYHQGTYPAVRPLINSDAREIRKHWSPLFEKYGLDNAFENHDHHYKRTFPIKAERRAADGVVYVGDGAWGVEPRLGDPLNMRYFEKSAAKRHFILMELKDKTRAFWSISSENKILDQWAIGRQISGPPSQTTQHLRSVLK